MEPKVTITTSSQLGFGWTHKRTPAGTVKEPAGPMTAGTPATLLHEYDRVRQQNADNDWRYELFCNQQGDWHRITGFPSPTWDPMHARTEKLGLLQTLAEPDTAVTVYIG